MLTKDKQTVKLIDFGFARNEKHYTPVDLYSLGVTLFVVLTGLKERPHVTSKLNEGASLDRLNALGGRFLDRVQRNAESAKMWKWDKLSTEAQDFIRTCCRSDPNYRPSAATMKNHPWLIEQKIADIKVGKSDNNRYNRSFMTVGGRDILYFQKFDSYAQKKDNDVYDIGKRW